MKFAVLASGEGETLERLLRDDSQRAIEDGRITCVISDRPDAYALERARRFGKPALVIDPREHPDREAFDRALLATLRRRRIDTVVLAGFMRILGPTVIQAYPRRIINVHPSLLPAFPGLHAPAQAVAHGVKVSGCTVHFVDEGVDTGPIIAQHAVDVLEDDTAQTLHARIKTEERRLLSKVVQLMARGSISCEGRLVRIEDPLPPEQLRKR